MMQSPSTRRLPHLLLLGTFVYEVFELETLAGRLTHHVADALFIAACVYAAGAISGKRVVTAGVALTGAAAWTLDLLGIQWHAFDIETALWMALHVALLVVLGRRMFSRVEISGTMIVDALSLYLISGILFAHVYGVILGYYPGALVAAGAPPGERIGHDLVLYYSFTTQVSMGLGDITPAAYLTRAVTIIQAIYGLMFVAVLISRFVTLHSAARWSRHLSSRP
jgi:hypothetical protein